jgi:outer membrane protein assembly factor BamB
VSDLLGAGQAADSFTRAGGSILANALFPSFASRLRRRSRFRRGAALLGSHVVLNRFSLNSRRAAMFGAALIPLGAIATLGWNRFRTSGLPASHAASVARAATGTARTAARPASARLASAAGFGVPLNDAFHGMTCFRGNAGRNFYGEGPAPRGALRVRWRTTIGADPREPQWNGVGWTGQPLAVEWPEGVRRHMNFLEPPGPETEIIVGGMDSQVHFYDAATGQPSRHPLALRSRNPIKGTVSIDPRGYPLLYFGTALGRPGGGYHIFSLTNFKELALLNGYDRRAPRRWPAFDDNGLIVNDTLLEPGENGLFYDVRLNARWDEEAGEVSIHPKVTAVPVTSLGIESSAGVWDHYAFATDNGGNLWRVDLNDPRRVKRLRSLGDDTDTSPTFDTDGTFYTGIQVDLRHYAGAKAALYKLRAPDGQLVWKWEFPAQSHYGSAKIHDINGGILGTPAVWPEGNLVFVTTAHHPRLNQGALVALDRETGKPKWTVRLRSYTWSSPTVVDGVVVAGDASGAIFVRDAATGATLLTDADGNPAEYVPVKATIEASPLIWHDQILIGIRGGGLVCLGN